MRKEKRSRHFKILGRSIYSLSLVVGGHKYLCKKMEKKKAKH